jgi:transcription elongation factor Elf1
MGNIPFACTSCGSETFKTAAEPKSLDDFEGAVCANCGAPFSKCEIEDQARQVAKKAVMETFRKAGFK